MKSGTKSRGHGATASLNFPVKGDPATALVAPNTKKVGNVTAWRRRRFLTLDEAARALRADQEKVAQLIRDGHLSARWYLADTGPVVVVKRGGVQQHAPQPFTDEDLGEDELVQLQELSRRAAECPGCHEMIQFNRSSLFPPHDRPDGSACPGGQHGSRFPIRGNFRTGDLVPVDEDLDEWLASRKQVVLDDAVADLGIPDDTVATAIQARVLRARWARIDGEAVPLVPRIDLDVLIGLANSAERMGIPLAQLITAPLPQRHGHRAVAAEGPDDPEQFAEYLIRKGLIPLDEVGSEFPEIGHQTAGNMLRDGRFPLLRWERTEGVMVLCVQLRRVQHLAARARGRAGGRKPKLNEHLAARAQEL